MNPVGDLRASFRGWADIVRGRPEASASFRLDATGLLIALGWFVVAVLLSVAVQSAAMGVPSLLQLSFGLFAQAVTLGMLWLAITQTRGYLKLEIKVITLLVPIVYAMAYMFVVAIPLALIGPAVSLLAVLALAVGIFFAGRTLGGMKTGVALAFAGLCLIVLVVVPNALYMLFLLTPTPA